MKSKTRPRTTFSFRINPKIKKDFLAIINKKKLNSCHILEALIVGWTQGMLKAPPHLGYTAGTTLVFNQKFENVVARDRRRKRQFRPEENCYSEKLGGIWLYVQPDLKSDVRENGHHISCECRDCSASDARVLRTILGEKPAGKGSSLGTA